MVTRRTVVAAGLAMIVGVHLVGCHSAPSVESGLPARTVGFPRCVAADRDGNQVVCAAPSRGVYDGDPCSCANSQGAVFFGRVQEYERR
jgi:hypothetical protein